MGIDADGIELLPIGQEIISSRLILERHFTEEDFRTLQRWASERPWAQIEARQSLPMIRITDGAYPSSTVTSIEKYMDAWQKEIQRVQRVLRFALLCVLESVSFTRKDGQYLRWDDRSGRRLGKKPFNKGTILDFDTAITSKLTELVSDVRLEQSAVESFEGEIRLFPGSCLDILPTLQPEQYDVIITSPPYSNRYDYTRTYALELALLGVSEREILRLRQRMLSSTVENRTKDLLLVNPQWTSAIQATDEQVLLQAILRYLEDRKARNELNNNGIPRMVRGYFYEMACVILECSRVTKPGGLLFMVNDNVRYAGASISVDMILSSIAEKLGFEIDSILVLPKGKGNSSQQMGVHGRESLRKCVYVWTRL
jgi:PAS domain-containing protein